MLCLSGFELYSRWVPLINPIRGYMLLIINLEKVFLFGYLWTSHLSKDKLILRLKKEMRRNTVSKLWSYIDLREKLRLQRICLKSIFAQYEFDNVFFNYVFHNLSSLRIICHITRLFAQWRKVLFRKLKLTLLKIISCNSEAVRITFQQVHIKISVV